MYIRRKCRNKITIVRRTRESKVGPMNIQGIYWFLCFIRKDFIDLLIMPYVVVLTIDRDLANVEVKNRYLTNDFPTFRTNTAKQAFSNIILYMLIT